MMYENIIVEAKIANPNRPHYEPLLGRVLKVGEIVNVKQKDLTPSSRVKVLCKCDLCDKDFERVRKDVKERTFCGLKCRNIFLKSVSPTLNIDKIKVSCKVCDEEFEVHPSKYKKQEVFLCSRDCYKKHRSKEYTGDKLYNYQDIIVECSNEICKNDIKLCNFDTKNRNNHFCSQECYWQHRRDNYVELYYVAPSLNKSRPETIPESKIRKILEENNIDFIQEYNIDKYFIDFYLPKYDIAIEVYGDYWHCNPRVYGNEENQREINGNQKKAIKHDKKRNKFLETIIKKVYIVWEYDINNDLENCMGTVLEDLLCKNP